MQKVRPKIGPLFLIQRPLEMKTKNLKTKLRVRGSEGEETLHRVDNEGWA